MEKPETPIALAKWLEDVLVNGSLYRIFSYDGSSCHSPTMSSRCANLPKQLKMYCGHQQCKKDQQWETGDVTRYFPSANFIQSSRYICRNCGSSRIDYFYIWQENREGSVFVKVGQYPALAIEPSPELSEALGEEDAGLYKKALIAAKFNHGLGAIAYFRRVLENKVNLILDLIVEALRNEQVEIADLKDLETIKASHRVEEKIRFASKILPSHLRPGGHNPLDKLYGAASAGLHGESDDDCLTIFNEARFLFEYLFKNLTVTNEAAREYVRQLSKPLLKKNPAPEAEASPPEIGLL